ncbi:uncharacterized protein [Clytia hemisphaerica]|uniref:PH domain-containing protein n=1 Tax=Clytia hemisphaerica TaxID=252671 RepID=A0A7M5XBF7_9CNID|eukprot:TCONS_00056387-protein
MNSIKSKFKSPASKKQKNFPGFIVLENEFIKSPPEEKWKNASWNKRYFILLKMLNLNEDRDAGLIQQGYKKSINNDGKNSSFCLLYWHDEAERRKGAKPIRVISLDNKCAVNSYKHPFWQAKYPHMIELKTPNRIFVLCADTEDSKRLWLDALHGAIEQIGHEDNQVKERSGSIDPIYATLYEVLREKRRPSESTWSTNTDDSGYGDDLHQSLNRSQSNSSGNSFCTNSNHDQIQSQGSTNNNGQHQASSGPSFNKDINTKRLSMPHHSLPQKPPPGRSLSVPDINVHFPQAAQDEDLYVDMTDQERYQYIQNARQQSPLSTNTKFTGFPNHIDENNRVESPYAKPYDSRQRNDSIVENPQNGSENLYANKPQPRPRSSSDSPVSVKKKAPGKPPRTSISESVKRLTIGSTITLEIPNNCTINMQADGLLNISTPSEEITISVHKKTESKPM